MNLNASLHIMKRELNSYFNSPVAYVFVSTHLFLSAFLTFYNGKILENDIASLDVFFEYQPWLYLMLIPAVTMKLWAEERQRGTLELLLSTPITTSQAIAGKFLAAWALLGLTMILTFPIPLTVITLGNPDYGPIVAGYIGCIMLSGAFLAIGSWASATSRSQIVSFLSTATIGLLVLTASSESVAMSIQPIAPVWFIEVVHGIGFTSHYQQMQRGLIDLRALIYFASIIFFMLLATRVTLDNRISK